DATSATQAATKGQSTADTATSDTPANGTSSNAVQTGNASMAVVILLALVSATGVVYFTRKRFNK
ncbi:MAG: LPXTG cell wall anchor domain-containing protein, partial [Ruminococcus sp.]|nr:LPXTG cell wall anchor domain-containing protein [Ruminococcus sp.]